VPQGGRPVVVRPPGGDDLIRSGYAKSNLNDHDGVNADYTRAIELKPDDAEYFYWSGYTKMSLGDREGGCADLKKAAKLGSVEVHGYLPMKDNCP
jgi:hypothetical protein